MLGGEGLTSCENKFTKFVVSIGLKGGGGNERIKGTVDVNDPSCVKWHVRFETVPFNF